MVILKSQTAVLIANPGPDAKIELQNDIPVPQPGHGEVLVKLECSGLCHSDIYNIKGAHPMSTNIPGHEGVGRIISLGPGLAIKDGSVTVGQRVGVKWIQSTCDECEICLRDRTSCPNQHNSGRDVPGTLQQYIVVPAKNLTTIPDGISSEEVAPLLCAGLTMYSAISKAKASSQDWIIIPGAGGGLGHLGVQIAARKGLKVIAIDSESKRDFCNTLGITAFFDFKNPNLEEAILSLTNGYGAHAVVCTAGSESAYDMAFRLVRRGGTVVCVGLPARLDYRLPCGPMDLVVRGLKVVGSSVGSEKEMQELLDMAVRREVVPHIQRLPLSEIQEAIDLVASSRAEGRIVLMIP